MGDEHKTPTPELYEIYAAWCRLYGYKPKAKNNIGEDWSRLGLTQGRTGKGRFWRVQVDKTADAYMRLQLPSERGF